MDPHYCDQLRTRLIPVPKQMECRDGVFPVSGGAKITLVSSADGEASMVREFFRNFFHAEVEVELQKNAVPLPPEGYLLSVRRDRCTITAHSRQTIGCALKTLRQLAEPVRGVLKSAQIQLPCVEIRDEPENAFRGIHLCFFPETPASEIEKQIRMAAWYKFNYCVLESWGVFKLDSHPEFCWEEFAVEKREVRRLVKLGRELGITLIPQFNIFGHASQARTRNGKHVLLNRHPEYAPLFEPDGWSWCLSNPATRQYLAEIVLELCELFDHPPFFHAGCDEAYNAGSCSLCAGDYPQKLADHLNYFHDLLQKQGTRMMMWHDMLLDRADPRWTGYTANGSKASAGLIGNIPKDMLICDWQYRYPEKDGVPPQWPTVQYFKDNGFDVLVCPWEEPRGIQSLGKCAAEKKLFGLLQTVWHHGGDSWYSLLFTEGAHSSWSPHAERGTGVSREYFNCHLRQVCSDMGLTEYTQFGTVGYQVDYHASGIKKN